MRKRVVHSSHPSKYTHGRDWPIRIFTDYRPAAPITVITRSKAWTDFARSNAEIVGSNPTQGMDVCVRLFCVCVVLCVGRGLARGDPPSKESYRLCIGSRNWKRGQGPTKGYRAIIICLWQWCQCRPHVKYCWESESSEGNGCCNLLTATFWFPCFCSAYH
jgi:hypothetical protein